MFTLTTSVNCVFLCDTQYFSAVQSGSLDFVPPGSPYCKYVPLCGSVVCFLTPQPLSLSSLVCLAAFHLISQLWSLTVSLTLALSLSLSLPDTLLFSAIGPYVQFAPPSVAL